MHILNLSGSALKWANKYSLYFTSLDQWTAKDERSETVWLFCKLSLSSRQRGTRERFSETTQRTGITRVLLSLGRQRVRTSTLSRGGATIPKSWSRVEGSY